MHLQILAVMGVDKLKPCADGAAVEVVGHAQLGIQEERLFDEGERRDKYGTDSFIGIIGVR